MKIDLKKLKNNRKKFKEQVAQKFSEPKKSKYSKPEDQHMWFPKLSENGTATATIRFLERVGHMELPWVERYDHSFQGPSGRWYIENSPTSIGRPCPLGEANRDQWIDGDSPEAKKAQAIVRPRSRRHRYYANILVINDPTQPEMNGQVKILRFGPEVYKIIEDAGKPDPDDPDKMVVDPFDPWSEGSDFKFKISKNDRGWTTYIKSYFLPPSAMGTDEEIEAIYEKAQDLSDLIMGEQNFKSYDELLEKFQRTQVHTSNVGPAASAPAVNSGEVSSVAMPSIESKTEVESLDELDELFED